MNKTITFLGTLAATLIVSGSLSAQSYFSEDFEGGSLTANNAWTQQQPVGTDTWAYDNYNGDNFAEINSYPNDAEAWLITPAINLTGATQPTLTFQNTSGNFDGPDLEVYVSTTYAGGAINMGDWTQVTIPNLSPGSGDGYTEVSSGDIDLTTYISANTYVAFRHQGTSASGGASQEYQIDDIEVAEPAVATTKSIYEIQYTTAPSGDSPEIGNLVSTGGIVSGVRSNGSGYWIQDNSGEWHGVFVYDNTNTPAVGDSITFDGTVDEYNGATQVESTTNFQIVSNGNTVYTPATVTVAQSQSEGYEGTYVRVENVTCTNASAAFGNWEVTDASGTTLVGKFIFDYTNRNDNDIYNVQGIAYVFDDGTTPEYQILTTNMNDVELVSSANIEENNFEMSLYPNPAQNNVTLVAPTKAQVEVVSVTGALIESFQTTNNKTVVSTTNIPAGVYFVKVTAENTTITEKLIVK